MAEDIITTTAPQTEAPRENRAEERITELSDKVKTTAGERDTEKVAREAAERERDFYKGFSETVATNPGAKDHQDEIKEKVLKGYSVQDATFAVLGAAGKLGNQASAPQVAGGSAATTTITLNSQKSPTEMSQAERREQLAKDLMWQ